MRHYRIDRDSDGQAAARLVWLGDSLPRVRWCALVLVCPLCGSRRMRRNRCLACWADMGRHEAQ